MPLETNLNKVPYFDDYDANDNYYRILFRPGTAVQARELTQLQTISQNQIEKLGKHLFVDGSVIDGCSLTFDGKVTYLKITDNYTNGTVISVSDLQDKFIKSSSNLQAYVSTVTEGSEGSPPDLKTLYIKYINTGQYANGAEEKLFTAGDTLSVLTSANVLYGSITTANSTSNVTGFAYTAKVSDGTIFHKGFMVRVPEQTVVVSKYNNTPNNISIGFKTIEEIITSDIDTNLLDNASGSYNFNAPGAHRLKLTPTLVTRQTYTGSESANSEAQVLALSNTENFFSIADFDNGRPSRIRIDSQYAKLGAEMARRTYEESGNYIVEPFKLYSTERFADDGSANTTHFNIEVDKGIGYVYGYRIQYQDKRYVPISKGIDTNSVNTQIITANFGNYINVNEFAGTFDVNSLDTVSLQDTPALAVSSGMLSSNSGPIGNTIGSAKVLTVKYGSGDIGTPNTVYKMYLFNLAMNSGKKFSNVRSVYGESGGLKGFADIVLESNNAVLQEPNLSKYIIPLGQNAVKSLRDANNNYNAYYTLRTSNNITFPVSQGSVATLSVPTSGVGTSGQELPYGGGVLSSTAEQDFIVIATSSANTANLTGTVSVTGNVVTGTGTSFNVSGPLVIEVGDFVYVSNASAGQYRLVTSVANATYLTVNSAFSNNYPAGATIKRHIPAGSVVKLTKPTANITVVDTSSANIYPGTVLNKDLTATVYYNLLKNDSVGVSKEINKNTVVKISLASNQTGPWCLGLSDITKLKNVYVGSTTGNSYSRSNRIATSSFRVDNKQKDGFYGLGFLYLNSGSSSFDANTRLLVEVDHFTHNKSSGVGFISVESYPIDDANTANSTAITTQEIPTYLASDGKLMYLRDCIDFRPIYINTANVTSNVDLATQNPSQSSTLDVLSSGASFICPDENMVTDFTYYLGRIDKVALTSQGQIDIINGVSSLQPRPPADKENTMTLGVVTIPPYPSLPSTVSKKYPDSIYKVVTTIQQNKRFTMRDIGTIEERVDRLEYYTTLSLLESATKTLLIKDSIGNDRFKNGFLVDPFNNYSIADTNSQEFNKYAPALDLTTGEIIPRQRRHWVNMDFDSVNSVDAEKNGSLITLARNKREYIFQRNATEGFTVSRNAFTFRGDITLSPTGNHRVDVVTNPVPVVVETQEFTGINSASETITRRHEINNYSGSSSQYTSGTIQTQNTTYDYNTSASAALTPSGTTKTYTSGAFVEDISFQEFLDPIIIKFSATGMLPNTRVYPYFDNINVSIYCRPANSSLEPTDVLNKPLVVNSDGCVYGLFHIPMGIFRTGERIFKLVDTNNLTTAGNTIKTEAAAVFYGSNIDITKSRIETRTRPVAIDFRLLTTIDQYTSTTTVSIPALPPVEPVVIENTNITFNDINNDYGSFNSYNNVFSNIGDYSYEGGSNSSSGADPSPGGNNDAGCY